MSTDFFIKCEILGDVHIEAGWNKELDEFREYNDLGLPLAYAVSKHLIELKKEGEEFVEETWKLLCQMLQVDPEESYEDSDDLLNKSPIVDDLKDEEDEE
jgi:hypothetical protein